MNVEQNKDTEDALRQDALRANACFDCRGTGECGTNLGTACGACKGTGKATVATFPSVQESRHDYLLQVERRARALYAHAKEQGGLGDQIEDCRYILEGDGLWKDVLE